MDKFLVVLLPGKLYLYRYTEKGMYEKFYINGEEYLAWDSLIFSEAVKSLKREILDVCNFEELLDVGFDVIYHQVDTNIVRDISQTMLPCQSWQIFSFEKVLPEILLRMKKIKHSSSIDVQFENMNYFVQMDEMGIIKVGRTDRLGECSIYVDDLLLVFSSTYEFVRNEKELEGKSALISKLDIENKKLEKEKAELNIKLASINKELSQQKKLIEGKEGPINDLEEKLVKVELFKSRSIVSVEIPMTPAAFMHGLTGTVEYNVNWRKGDGHIVKAGDLIANITTNMSYNYDIICKISGRLFCIVHNGVNVKKGQVIAVISDPSDSTEEIKKWLSSFC